MDLKFLEFEQPIAELEARIDALKFVGEDSELNISEEISRLRHMFDNFRDTTPAEHIEEYSDANIAFHQAIVELSKSQIILDTIKNIFVHVRAIRRMTISQSDRAARSIVDHLRIIEALEARDTELAERLVRQHSLDLAAYVDANCDFLD